MYNIFRGREYKEYYIPYDWIGDKKYQLNNRLYKHVVDLLRERGYRIVNSRPWYEMIKWADKPDKYLNNKNFSGWAIDIPFPRSEGSSSDVSSDVPSDVSSTRTARFVLDDAARIIQNAWRNYKRPESLASQIWNAVRNDNTPNDKKFLGLTAREVKNPQTRDQFNLWIAENLAMYRHYPSMYNIFRGREYKEYYIPYDWIGDKKYQLNNRLYKHVVDLLRERGYRIVNSRPWYEMIKWADKPDKYLNNKNFVRIE
ncbi:13029_t:CDS:2 [Entrophospora sp. SA101]|nr:13029_t:CDS:2 [Entrophospora sp. SA101]